MKKRTRLLSLVLAIAMIFTMMPISLTASAASSITISSAAELMAFAKKVNSGDSDAISAKVTIDDDVDEIDLTGYTWVPIGTKDYPFLGTFDGNGCVIKGITCTNAVTENGKTTYTKGAYGLFGYVGLNSDDGGAATITDVIISDSTFTLGGTNILFGAVAGCVVSKAGTTGFQTDESTVSKCGVTNSVYCVANLTGGTNALGGVVGTFAGTFEECYSRANISLSTGKKNVNCHVGGVIGRADRIGATISLTTKTEISDAYFAGRITSDSTSSKCYVGGVIGGTMDKDTLTDFIANLVGAGDILSNLKATEPSVARVYNAGTLSAAKIGGIAGYNLGGEFEDCYYHASSAPYAYVNETVDEDSDGNEVTVISTVVDDDDNDVGTFTDSLDKSKLRKSIISNSFIDSKTSYPYPMLDGVADSATLDNTEGTVYNPASIYSVATLKAVADHPDWYYKVTADFGVTREASATAYYSTLTSAQKKSASEKLGLNKSQQDVYTAATTYDSSTTYYLDQAGTEATIANGDFDPVYAFKSGVTYYTYDEEATPQYTAASSYVDGTTYYLYDSEATPQYTAASTSDFDISGYKFNSAKTYYTKSTVDVYGEITLAQVLALTTAQENTLISEGLATSASFADSFTITPIPSFTGSIDGNGKTITGMTIYVEDSSTTEAVNTQAALFGTNFGQIKDLTFKNTTVTMNVANHKTVDGTYYAATVAANNYGTLTNIKTDATVTAINGVVGSSTKATYIGGIAAINHGTISDAYNTGVDLFKLAEGAIADDEENQKYEKIQKKALVYVGGLVGRNDETGLVSGQSVNAARSELIGVDGVRVGTYCGYNVNDEANSVTGTTLADNLASSNFLAPYDPGTNISTDDKTSAAVTTGVAMGKGTISTLVGSIEPSGTEGQETYDLDQRVLITATDTEGNKYNVTYFRNVKIALKEITVEIDSTYNEYYAVTGSFKTSGINVIAFKGTDDERTLSKVSSAEEQGYTVHIYTDAACTQEFTGDKFTVAGTYYLQLKYGDNILITGLNSTENRTTVPNYIDTFVVNDVSSIKIDATNHDLYMAGQTPKVDATGTIKLGTGDKAKTTTKDMGNTTFPCKIFVDGAENGTLAFNPKLTTDTEFVDGKIYYSDANCTQIIAEDDLVLADISTYYTATAEVYLTYTFDTYEADGVSTTNTTITSEKTFVNVTPSDIEVDSLTVTSSADEGSEVKANSIQLDWTSTYGTDVKYIVYRKAEGETEYKKLFNKNKLTYTDETAVPGTTYEYKVVMYIGGAESTGDTKNSVTKLCPLPTSVAASVYNVRVAMGQDYNGRDGVTQVKATWKNGTTKILDYSETSSELFDTLNYTVTLSETFDSSVNNLNKEYTATVQYLADGTNLSNVKLVDDAETDATFKIIVSGPTSITATSKYDCYPTGYESSYFLTHLTVVANYNYPKDTENNIAALDYKETISNKTNSNGITLVGYDSSETDDKGRAIVASWKVSDALTLTTNNTDESKANDGPVVCFHALTDAVLTATTGDVGYNTITWDQIDGADSYTVYRKASTDEDYDKVKTVKPVDAEYELTTDTALDAGKTYYSYDKSSKTYTEIAAGDLNVENIATYYEKEIQQASYLDKKSEPGVTYSYKVVTNMADRSSDGNNAVSVTTISPDYIKLVTVPDNAKTTYAIGDEYKKPNLTVMAFYKNPDAMVYTLTKDTALDETKTYYTYDSTADTYTAVAAENLDVANIATYYEYGQVTAAYYNADTDFATIEKNAGYSQRKLTYSATAEAYKYQVDSSAFNSATAGTYTITVKYADNATYNGKAIGSYDVNVYGVNRLSVTTNAKAYPDTTAFSDVVFTVKAVYGTATVTSKEEVLASDAWTITSPTDTSTIMSTTGTKTVTIALASDTTITGTVSFSVYDPDAIITPEAKSGITRSIETIGTTDTTILSIAPTTKAGILVSEFLVNANFEVPTLITCLEVYKADGTKIENTDYASTKLGTGFVVKLYAEGADHENDDPTDVATIVVRGDVNGDGLIKAVDYVTIRKHILKTSLISTGTLTYLAADYDGNGTIKAVDYATVRKMLINTTNTNK